MNNEFIPLLMSLREFAEEANATHTHGSALDTVKEQVNKIYEAYRSTSPDSTIWQICQPLGADDDFSHVILLCILLERSIEEKLKSEGSHKCWHITKDFTMQGHHNGDVVVEPGITFNLQGHLDGNVALMGTARLVCMGCIDGDVIADEDSTVEYMGVINGSIVYREKTVAGDAE